MATDGSQLVTVIISTAGALLGALIGSITGYLTARHQFRTTVVAAARQQWISSVRDALAEYQVSVTSIAKMFVIPASDPAIRDQTYERAAFLTYRLKLLLNPRERSHLELLVAIEALFAALTPALKSGDHSQAVAQIRRVTELGQLVLKSEWERVKAGE